MSTRNYSKIPGSILEYSFLNKTVQKDAGISAPSLKKTLGHSTLSQTKDAYLSNKLKRTSFGWYGELFQLKACFL